MTTEGAGTGKPQRQYVVVGRSTASAIIESGQQLVIESNTPASGERVQIIFRTRYRQRGFEVLVPDVLWVDARGTASGLKEAAEAFANRARDLALILAVSANASMGDVDVELAYDDTPGEGEHEYLQVFIPDPPPPTNLVPSRRIPFPASIKLVEAIGSNPYASLLVRAASQYSMALGQWKFGNETMALEHLFMGLEALKPAAIAHVLAERSCTDEHLAAEWGFVEGAGHMTQTEFLLAETRDRILFQGDKKCRRTAKTVSDAFEHGFTNPGELRPLAIGAVVPTARYLRESIFTLSGVDQETRAALLAPPYAEPLGPLRAISYLWGRLSGPAGNLAARDQEYPICEWVTSLKNVRRDEKGNYTMSFDQKLTAKLGEGVTLKPTSSEIWNGATLKERKPPPTEGTTT